jgi:hypothetical protein
MHQTFHPSCSRGLEAVFLILHNGDNDVVKADCFVLGVFIKGALLGVRRLLFLCFDRLAVNILCAPFKVNNCVANVAEGFATPCSSFCLPMYLDMMQCVIWRTVWRIENSMSSEMMIVPL